MDQETEIYTNPKLFMVLLGSKAPQRNVEQHDYFFGIAPSLSRLVPQLKAFWPEAGSSLHIDGWREINLVDGYQVKVIEKNNTIASDVHKLFFINLGGYQTGKLEEQHYTMLCVKPDTAQAVQDSKKTIFFKSNSTKGANSHIDEKYGIDVDDIYRLDDILSPDLKKKYQIQVSPADIEIPEDQIHLGYFKLDKIESHH
ncbi:DUF1543 domain-containing protein [Pedobacter frigoris]|uniref:DUF1543 domain-containing protein n=2 Tax=Pedobacter frigoris TaxID=2571272 RepID=A0A4U1CS28_9SPHI|nr:DUF1543 domain-containing protein [Pedobacter frigoris]